MKIPISISENQVLQDEWLQPWPSTASSLPSKDKLKGTFFTFSFVKCPVIHVLPGCKAWITKAKYIFLKTNSS